MKNFGEFFNNQIEHAGTIILSRTQNISDDKVQKAIEMIRTINKDAHIITTDWELISGEQILSAMENVDNLELQMLAEQAEKTHQEHEHEHHHHDGECCCGHDHEHEHEHEHDHAYLHAHGIPHSHGHVHENQKAVVNRLSRAIGHLEKVRRMVENGEDCSDVLIQLAAVRSALDNTGKVILKDHMRHCMVDAVAAGDQEAIDDLCQAIDKFMK